MSLKGLKVTNLNVRHPKVFEDGEVKSCQRLVILEIRFTIKVNLWHLELSSKYVAKRLTDIFAKANETFRYQSEFNNQINLDSTQSLHNI